MTVEDEEVTTPSLYKMDLAEVVQFIENHATEYKAFVRPNFTPLILDLLDRYDWDRSVTDSLLERELKAMEDEDKADLFSRDEHWSLAMSLVGRTRNPGLIKRFFHIEMDRGHLREALKLDTLYVTAVKRRDFTVSPERAWEALEIYAKRMNEGSEARRQLDLMRDFRARFIPPDRDRWGLDKNEEKVRDLYEKRMRYLREDLF